MSDMTKGGTLGGGEVLPYIGQSNRKGTQYIDWGLVKQYTSIPMIKAIIIILLILICTLIILRLFNIKSLFKGKGILSEISNIDRMKNRDRFVIQSNRFLARLVKIVQSTPFMIPLKDREYLDYNLKRANIKVTGGYRYMSAVEFNAIVKTISFILVCIALISSIFVSSLLGILIIAITIVVTGVLPKQIIRSIVREKDREIRNNFSDFYLMLHYVLVMGGNTPIDKIMKSYSKTTDSQEMLRFVDNCIGHIDTHGEYGATTLIARDYREIPEVGKLMRLIRQLYDGAEIEQELIGFREELIKERKLRIEQRMNGLVLKANLSLRIILILLVQAILSAMALYLPDLGTATSFL